MRPMVSVVITNFNGREDLKNCLASVARSTYPLIETIVVDNSSTDGSTAMVRRDFPEVALLVTGRISIGEAINHGISRAHGEIIAFLDNDTTVQSGWLEPLVSTLEDSSNIGIVGGKALLMSDPTRLFSAGARIRYLTGFAPLIGGGKKDAAEYNARAIVDYVNFPVFKKTLVSAIGYFDSVYYLPFTETDFCLRARKHGFKVMYVPTSVMCHRGGGTYKYTGRNELRNYYLYRRNRIRFVVKNFPIWALAPALFRLLVIETIADTTWFVFRRRSQFMIAQLRAIYWNLVHMKNTLRGRGE